MIGLIRIFWNQKYIIKTSIVTYKIVLLFHEILKILIKYNKVIYFDRDQKMIG